MRILITGGSGFIGTSLVEDLSEDHDLLNIDILPPKIDKHHRWWKSIDIMDSETLNKAIVAFSPDVVVHLAARTDTDGSSLADYAVNTQGTKNLLDAITDLNCVTRFVLTSTQYVNQYNGLPRSDLDYAPHTIYGESKVISEKMTRDAKLNLTWTIIRPTNIWGPWHLRYPYEFWRVLGLGYYFHPGGDPVIRSYGYVQNVSWQICQIIGAPSEIVASKVYYVGDRPIDLLSWVNGFSLLQRGRNVIIVPRSFIWVAAKFGDLLKMAGVRFPITSSRYRSMTTSNDASMDHIFKDFGVPPYSLDDGIRITVNWLRIKYPELVKKND